MEQCVPYIMRFNMNDRERKLIAIETILRDWYAEEKFIEVEPFKNKTVKAGVFTPNELTLKMVEGKIKDNAKILVVFRLEMALALKNYADIDPSNITIYTTDTIRTQVATSNGFDVVTNMEDCMNKFDIIIMNPPYHGKARLHQKFFNNAVEAVKDNGKVISIHPATPYFNKKRLVSTADKLIAANLKAYVVDTKIVDSGVFGKDVAIATALAITTLTKTESEMPTINSFEYENGNVHKDISLEDISMTGEKIDPKVYRDIRIKYSNLIAKNGSIEDNMVLDGSHKLAYMAKFRGSGHVHWSHPEFFTLVSKNTEHYHGEGDYGLKVKNEYERANAYTYMRTNAARLGLSFLKMNLNIATKELTMVPMVDLSKEWTDAKLYKLLKLTDTEIRAIEDFLPDYYV